MRLLATVLGVLAAFALASVLAVYSYGRFAEQARGEPSFSLPVAAQETRLDRLTAPLLEGREDQTGLMLLAGNLNAFAVRALSARYAERSLDLQYYIWDGDLTGRLLANEVLKAADRGVRVRLLLDDINARGYDRTLRGLHAHPNIAVRLFNPSRNREGTLRRGIEMLLRAFTATRRMHNKAWIADGRLAVVGGRNIGDAYFSAAPTANFRDLDLLALGAAVRQTGQVFDDFWNSRAVIPIDALRESRGDALPELRKELERVLAEERTRPYLDRVIEDETVREVLTGEEPLHWTREAKVVSDPPAKAVAADREGWLMGAIRPLITSAESDLAITSPYFVPGEAGTGTLAGLAGKGVRVSVLTNSLAATDVLAVHGAYARYREPLVAGGVRLFELKPYDERGGTSLFGSGGVSLHTKAFTVDGHTGFVGSMNFDPRSVSLNTEMGIIFEHDALVGELRDIFAEQTSPWKSYRVRLDGGEIVWRHRAADGSTRVLHREPQTEPWRRLAARVIGLLPIESQL